MAYSDDNLKDIHNTLLKEGYTPPAFDVFKKDMSDENNLRGVYNTLKKEGYTPPEFDVFRKDMFGEPAQAPVSSTEQVPQSAGVEVGGGVGAEADAAEGWQPSVQEKIAMRHSLDSLSGNLNADFKKRQEALSRQQELMSAQGKQAQRGAELMARAAGVDTRLLGLGGSGGSEGDQKDGTPSDGPQGKARKQSPVVIGLENDENGNKVAVWQLGDGSQTRDIMEAERAEFSARKARLEDEFVERMRSNGLDVSKSEDVERQRQLDFEAPFRKSMDKIWDDAGRKYDEAYDKKVKGLRNMYSGAPTTAAVAGSFNVAVDDMKVYNEAYDLNKMINELWSQHSDDFTRAAGSAAEGKKYAAMVVYEYVKNKRLPRSKSEYFWDQVMNNNLIMSMARGFSRKKGAEGDWAAIDQALAEYGEDKPFLRISSGVTGMALDPTTAISGIAGGLTSNLFKGAVARRLSQSLGGRMLLAAPAGAASIGAYNLVKDSSKQFERGGVLNPLTLENEGYKPQDILKSTAEGLILGSFTGAGGAFFGNYGTKLARGAKSTINKSLIRGAQFGTTVLYDGTIFSVPAWINGEGGWDVWTDNVGFALGLKTQHGVMGGLRTVAEEISDFRSGGKSLGEFVREGLDGLRSDVEITEDEFGELKEKGYGTLGEIFRKRGDKRASKSVTTDRSNEMGLKSLRIEDVEHPETIDYPTLERAMQDETLSQSVRAKLWWILTGKSLPVSTIMGCNFIENEDGSFRVESTSADGVVTSRSFKKRWQAEEEQARIMHQVTLNSIAVGEQFNDNALRTSCIDGAIYEIAPEFGVGRTEAELSDVRERYMEYVESGKEPEGAMMRAIDARARQNWAKASGGLSKSLREFIEKKYDVDISEAARKTRRSENEEAAVKEYLEQLYRFNQTAEAEAQEATSEQSEAKILYDEAKLLSERFERGEGPDAKDIAAISERMRSAERGIEEEFGDDYEDIISILSNDPWEGFAQSEDMTSSQRAAVIDYINARAAVEGVIDGSSESIDKKAEAVKQEVAHRTHRESGVIIPVTTSTGESTFLISGKVVMSPDGKGILRSESDDFLIIIDPKTGEYAPTAPNYLMSVEPGIDPSTELELAMQSLDGQRLVYKEDGGLQRADGSEVFGQPAEAEEMLDSNDGKTLSGGEILGENEAITPGDKPNAPEDKPGRELSPGDKQTPEDKQGNPVDSNGQLILHEVDKVANITDKDFTSPTRNVALPSLPSIVNDVLGANGKRPIIKKNIFRKNHSNHQDLTPEDSRNILLDTLYDPNLYGQNQKASRPYNWILIHLSDRNSAVILEVDPTKENLEIVNWHYLGGRQLEQKKEQAEREGGLILTLPEGNAAGNAPYRLLSDSKGIKKSAYEQIPVDESGQPMWTEVDATTGWEALVEKTGDEDTALGFARMQADIIKDEVAAAKRKKVAKTSDIDAFMAADKQRKEAIAAAESRLAKWEAIVNVKEARDAEVQRAEEEAARQKAEEEALRLAAEKAERAALKNIDNDLAAVYDEVKDVPEAVERLKQLAPETIDEVASLVLSTHKLLWNSVKSEDGMTVRQGVKAETGYGEGERRKLFGMFASAANGGMTLERLAEDVFKEYCDEYGISYDNQEARNALIEMISSAQTPSDIRRYIERRRAAQALGIKRDKEREFEEIDSWYREVYHMGAEEYLAYEDAWYDEAARSLINFDEAEYYDKFADEILEQQSKENEYRSNEISGPSVLGRAEGNESSGTIAGNDNGVEILPEQGVVASGGDDASSRGQGVSAGTGDKMPASPSSLSDGASGIGAESDSDGVVGTKYDRTVPTTEAEKISAIRKIVNIAKQVKDRVERAVIGGITTRQAEDFKGIGLEIDNSWVHSIENSAITHNQNHHGNVKAEDKKGQIAIAEEDYAKIPDILENYDKVSKSSKKTGSGNVAIVYTKEYDDGYIYYLEEKRDSRKSLAFHTMYKKKKGADSSDGLLLNATPFTSKTTPDNLSDLSADKGSEKGGDKQIAPKDKQKIPQDSVIPVYFNLTEDNKQEGKRDGDLIINNELDNKAIAYNLYSLAGKSTDYAHFLDRMRKSGMKTHINRGDTLRAFYEAVKSGEIDREEGRQYFLNRPAIKEPTEAQKLAGNYKKKHVRLDGYNISIENEKGSFRRGKDAEGNEWETEMQHDYGYIRGTEGLDGDHIDVFLSDSPEKGDVFVVDQVKSDGSFDEHKVMYGFPDIDSARKAYLSNYKDGWTGLGTITQVSKEEFKKWVNSSKRKTKPFAEYASVKQIESQQENGLGVEDGIDFSEASESGIAREQRVDYGSGESLEAVNARFNAELQQQIDGTLPHGHVYQIGRPGDILKAAGFPNAPIEMSASHLAGKAAQRNHEFGIEDIKNLPMEIQTPIAVFRYGDKGKAENVIVGIDKNGKQFVVGVHFNQNRRGIVVSDIRGLFPKENAEWLNWISQGKAEWLDKEKIQALISQQRTNLAEVKYLDLDDVAKIVKEFENPKLGDGDNIEAVNARFNDELQQQIEGTLPQGHVYELGMPSEALRKAGFPALPIRMRASLLTYKSTMNRHPFDISDVTGLVKAMANPVAVFEYSKDNMRNLIVDITHGDKHFLVGVTLNYKAGDIEINSVSGLFPKDTASWLKWIQDGKAIQIGQKDKVQALIDSLRTNPADAARIGLNLEDVAKIVKEFENPKLELDSEENAVGASEEVMMRDAVIDLMRKAGIEVSTDWEEGQRVLDEVNGRKGGNGGARKQLEAPVFYSNAERAVEGVKQEKATAEQWLSMLQKNGGLKAGEDKWLGLSEWLGERKGQSVTKEEILNYIRANKIEIEEVSYSEHPDGLDELKAEYDGWLRNGGGYDYAQEQLRERFGDDADIAFTDLGGELVVSDPEAASALLGSEKVINATRLDYTTEGLTNKREIALTVPTVESWNEGDVVHFGDAGGGRAVAWVRFGEYPRRTSNHGKVLVIDEIQSKRHQDGREHGYREDNESRLREVTGQLFASNKEYEEYIAELSEKYGSNAELDERVSDTERSKINELYSKRASLEDEQRKVFAEYSEKVPDAPFAKNWHELAMKRMLRYAAEHGYDKVAWTRGEQQAERYDIEGEGMKGFYDLMLPRFMDKYGKKWGVKTHDIELPELEGKGKVMHAVDVTEAMKKSVRDGQPMFFRTKNGEAYGYTLNGKVYIDPRIATSETPVHEYHHLWAEALERANPEAWEYLKDQLFKDRDLTEWVKSRYPDLADNENDLAHEVFAQFGGKRGNERLKREQERMEKENKDGILGKARIVVMFNKLREALNKYWQMARDLFAGNNKRLKGMSAEDFADMAMNDLLNNVKPEARERKGSRTAVRLQTGKSLFDWAEENDNASSREMKEAGERANRAIDEFVERFYEFNQGLMELSKASELSESERAVMEEQLNESLSEAKEKLEYELREFYGQNNTTEDARRLSQELSARTIAEAEIRLNGKQILRDIIEQDKAPELNPTFDESEVTNVKTAGGLISYRAMGHLPDAKEGEFAFVERMFSLSGEFSFTGKNVIKDRGDVAYMFRALEDYSIENVFVVFVKDGKPSILHIGMGSATWSAADTSAISAGYDAFGAEKIYLVHNHPSGKLSPSNQDSNLMRRLEDWAEKHGVETEGLIMDTTSGRYSTFTSEGKIGEFDRDVDGESTEAPLYKFDRAKSDGEALESATQVSAPIHLVNFINGLRSGVSDKVSYFVMSNNGKIIGNFHTRYGSLSDEGLARELSSTALKYGGVSVVIYGNVDLDGVGKLSEEVNQLSLGGIRVLDGLQITNEVEIGYRSAIDNRMIAEPDSFVNEVHDVSGESLESILGRIKAEAAQANTDNLQAKYEAMRAMGGNLNQLRSAMARQREYDESTAKSIKDVARALMDNGLLHNMAQMEVKSLLAATTNAIGRKDITKQVKRVFDVMLGNHLRHLENELSKVQSIKGSRVDGRGVKVAGRLDAAGERAFETYRRSKKLSLEEIDAKLEEALSLTDDVNDYVSERALQEYTGLQMARKYVEGIKQSRQNVEDLRESLEKAEAEAKGLRGKQRISFNEYKEAVEERIREELCERVEAYEDLIDMLRDVAGESVDRVRAWREAQKARINDIRHDINADIQGRRVSLYHPKNGNVLQQIANMRVLRYVMRPLMTFDQMLKMLGNKSIDGKGYTWIRFILNGIIPASEQEYKGYQEVVQKVDDKVSELFGKGKDASWLRQYTSKGDTVEVTLNDMGEERTYKVTRGAVMAVYAFNKMNDGKMKLRRMGITEEDVARMSSEIDSRLIEFMDWAQGDLLPWRRPKYAKVYENINGTSMPEVENYFPLPILETDLEEKDKVEKRDGKTRPSTTTGSWKKRTVNQHALDILNSDAVELLFDNIKENEHMAAYGELNRDLGTLLSSKRLKLAMLGMTTTAYGAGEKLWKNFQDCISVAVDEYRPKSGELDAAYLNLAKGVTSSKIWGGLWTAAKQATSLPANLADMKMRYFAETLITPWKAWNWAMGNLPLFEKRWKSKMSGDPRLMPTDVDWRLWKHRYVEIAQRLGLTPNAFIDALTCAVVAYPVYKSKIDKYNRLGYGADKAHTLALAEAEIAFNSTQQSSEGAFLSPMQKDRTFFSVLYTIFRNASMGYTRQFYDSARNLERLMTGQISVEYMAKKILRDSETRTISEIFDAEIEQQIAGTLPVGHVYQLGKPGGVLRSAGIEDLPIQLSAERLAIKASEAYRSGHPFPLEAVKGLVKAINNPIAVFDSATKAGVKVILTTLKHNGNNFIVALEAQNSYTHRTIEADINSVLSIYPKDAKNGILHWIANGALRYCDHKKTRDFFAEQWANSIDGKSLDITLKRDAKQRINLADVDVDLLERAANIVNSFENADIPEIENGEEYKKEDWDRAKEAARREIWRGALRSIFKLAIFGYWVQFCWNIFKYLPYLILGKDEDEKDRMVDDALNQSQFGALEGLTGGDIISDALNALTQGRIKSYQDLEDILDKDMPISSDIANLIKSIWKRDTGAASNDVLNLLLSSMTGTNIQRLEDIYVAIKDLRLDNASEHEVALVILRIIGTPQSQLDKIYFDELDMTGTEASKLTPTDIAERYAEYKMFREAPLTGWLRAQDKEDEIKSSKKGKVKNVYKDVISKRLNSDKLKELLAETEVLTGLKRQIDKQKEDDIEGWRRGMRELHQQYDMKKYHRVNRYIRDINELSKRLWVETDTEKARHITNLMISTRDKLLEDVERIDMEE